MRQRPTNSRHKLSTNRSSHTREPNRPIRALVAAAPRSFDPIVSALGSAFQLVHASHLSQAKSFLSEPFDVIVCGMHFDDSRMFDLLRYAKAEERTRPIPFLAVKATAGDLSPTLLQSVEIACGALGAEKFVDLSEWETRFGIEATHARFRALIERVVMG